MIDSWDNGYLRVLLAGDDPVARSRVRVTQAGAPGIIVIAETTSPEHTATLATRLKPHVVVATCAESNGDRASSIRHVASVTPGCRTLVVSECPDDAEWLLLALDAGAAGVVSIQASRDELASAIRAVAHDQIVLRRSAVAVLTQHARNGHAPPDDRASERLEPFERLTDRERSVFRLIAEGYSAPEVGAQLRISKKTVETYKKRITEKLGCSHRADYVRFALRMGVLSTSYAGA